MRQLETLEVEQVSGGLSVLETVQAINSASATFSAGAYGWASLPATPMLDQAGLNGFGGVFTSVGSYIPPAPAPTEGVQSINFFTPRGAAIAVGREAASEIAKRLREAYQ